VTAKTTQPRAQVTAHRRRGEARQAAGCDRPDPSSKRPSVGVPRFMRTPAASDVTQIAPQPQERDCTARGDHGVEKGIEQAACGLRYLTLGRKGKSHCPHQIKFIFIKATCLCRRNNEGLLLYGLCGTAHLVMPRTTCLFLEEEGDSAVLPAVVNIAVGHQLVRGADPCRGEFRPLPTRAFSTASARACDWGLSGLPAARYRRAPAVALLQQLVFNGVVNELGIALEVQFGKDAGSVGADRCRAQIEISSDLFHPFP
jgi:hypothetical protein